MQIVLRVIQGPHLGQQFTFDGHDNFIVGRARTSHFRLPQKDPFISRVHFMVEANPPHCRLMDMGSTNGTCVNGKRVQVVDLKDGDLIEAGEAVLRVHFMQDQEVSTVAEPSHPATREDLSSRSRQQTEIDRAASADVTSDTGLPKKDRPFPLVRGYQIVREIGHGGMGVVYLATRDTDGSQVAVKIIRLDAAESEVDVQRFIREARILQQLRHPHIVPFLEMGSAAGSFYLAMDYVHGTDAGKLVMRHGSLAVGRVVRLVCQALEALDYAHQQGFVHRDVNPANLLISEAEGGEICKVADFGLARAYQASPVSGITILGDVGGTLPFMPPEQITNFRQVDPAADQYSTAATTYYLLTGQFAYDFQEVPKEQRIIKILFDDPVPMQNRRPDLPAGLCDVVHRALQRRTTDRFPNAAAFRDALLPFGGGK
jgi:serine/threonine-protein kinase